MPKKFYSPPYRAVSLFTIMGILVLCIADGFLTDVLISNGAREANPIMQYLMDLGMVPFLLGKYLITACSVCFLLLLRNRHRFRMSIVVTDLLPLVQLFYTLLIIYEAFLMSIIVLQK